MNKNTKEQRESIVEKILNELASAYTHVKTVTVKKGQLAQLLNTVDKQIEINEQKNKLYGTVDTSPLIEKRKQYAQWVESIPEEVKGVEIVNVEHGTDGSVTITAIPVSSNIDEYKDLKDSYPTNTGVQDIKHLLKPPGDRNYRADQLVKGVSAYTTYKAEEEYWKSKGVVAPEPPSLEDWAYAKAQAVHSITHLRDKFFPAKGGGSGAGTGTTQLKNKVYLKPTPNKK